MIISQTPLRISFAGGGTDITSFYQHEEGWVISSAIDKYVYVIVKERFDDKIYINYSQKECIDHVHEIKHDLVREAMKKVGIKNGVEITTLADIPSSGSGLGSSSSVTVGLLNALYAYKGDPKSAETLAREACEIEIDILGKPIGKQDQYIAAYGGVRFFKFKPDGTVDVEKINLVNSHNRAFGANLMLFYTGITRNADKILEAQKQNTADKLQVLRSMKYMAAEVREFIKIDQFDKVGEILSRGWECKSQLADHISNPTIQAMYRRVMEAGALGAKISGAGGGGFLLVYCPREKQKNVSQVMNGFREFPFFLEKDGSKIIFNISRYDWK
jgi:D-glycero-alpha-D-manno-heptose-7-phosphate kinase